VISSSDGFYTSAAMLNRPDKARTMGEGWETRRRRDEGNDHAIIRLAFPGHVQLVEIDTAHFKYNASAELALFGAASSPDAPDWQPLLPRQRLQPDTRHLFRVARLDRPCSRVRIDAFPDGGMSRVRLWGRVDTAARAEAGLRWFNSLPSPQAIAVLLRQAGSKEQATLIASHRPLRGSSLTAVVDILASRLLQDIDATTYASLEEIVGAE
jgi:allantoicase